MSKTLALISVTGFALSLLFFTLAFLVAGGQIFRNEKPLVAIKPLIDLATHKEWRWDGGDTLAVNAPMVLHYQAGGPPHVTVTGPPTLLEHVRVGGGQIGSDVPHRSERHHRSPEEKLAAVVGGVPIRKFVINGREQLQLGHIDQDSLDIRINDGGSVSAEGRVGQLNIIICGSGHADLGKLVAQNVKATILGDGDAALAPQKSLYLTIAGDGVVRLLSRPASIQKTILGSGQIIGSPPAATSAPPQPPQMPQMPHPPESPPDIPSTNAGAGGLLVTGNSIRDLGHFEQDDLRVMIVGSGGARATGRVGRLTVVVSGSGSAKLAGLSARQVSVTIAGSGNATIAPEGEAHVTIVGSGNVYLVSRPVKIDRNITGSGRVIEQY